MKIVFITAGAAGMYCGSCFRDNALAAELLSRGHKVILVPTYTPTRTDEENVSQKRVFFGGISVYLEQRFSVFRKTPRLLDRLWDSTLALKLATRTSITVDPHKLGELTLSMLKGEAGNQRKEIEKLTSWLKSESPPDVVTLPNSLLIGLARPIKRAVGRPVCCTLQGEELFLEALPAPYRTESLDLIRRNTGDVDLFIAVSDYCADFMSDYLEIPREKIEIVPLGINLEGYEAARSLDSIPFTIGFFARVAPEKGLHVLCETYRRLRHRNDLPKSRLEVAGYLRPEHKPYLKAIQKDMRAWGLADEFHYRGVLDRQEKIEFLRGLHLLSVPATYDEPKGMFLLEAMANGVPVVQPRRGAFPEIIEKTRGGLLVAPDNCDSLADGILSVWKDPELRAQLGRHGLEGVRRHYGVAQMADRALEVYSRLGIVSSSRIEAGICQAEF